MDSREVRVLASASEEIEEAVAWLSARSKNAAQAFAFGYEEKLCMLASGLIEYPLSHIPELARLGYRATSFGAYTMLYYVENDVVFIAHVFHQHRNYARLVARQEEEWPPPRG